MPTRIDIRGVIIPNDEQWIYDWFEVESTSPGRVSQAISDASGDDLEVVINSGGGDVFSGSEIYTALKGYPGNVTVKIVGAAASAASVAAMGGNKVEMSPTSLLMIHNARARNDGDKRDHRHAADFLHTVDQAIANAYRLKTGMLQSELLALMNKETWMNAQDALEKGFIDEIMFDEGNQLRAVASAGAEMIPAKVIDRLRNEILKQKPKGEKNNMDHPQTQNPASPQAAAASTTGTVPPTTTVAAVSTNAADAAVQERERLKAIDAIASNIDPALVEEAKYGANPMNAEQLAFRAMKEGKMINSGVFDAAVAANKAAGTGDVQAQAQPQGGEREYDLSNLKDVNEVFAQIATNSMADQPRNIRRR
ncbi:head maturation protease, ClpP-related [Paenibacillus tyrfis]|uniref:head maturation protease, ClpP-related n=1 Tax=Paenibacillus tyrfis TaxID=1501230 RepID=UPI00068EA602|nr:head maturation protease, ClpP-related [Paenibacillus tyrfis]